MIVNLYSLRDVRIERSNVPFYARNDQEANVILIRSGIPESIYNDSKLFNLGSFDDETGNLSVADSHEVKLLPFPAKE